MRLLSHLLYFRKRLTVFSTAAFESIKLYSQAMLKLMWLNKYIHATYQMLSPCETLLHRFLLQN